MAKSQKGLPKIPPFPHKADEEMLIFGILTSKEMFVIGAISLVIVVTGFKFYALIFMALAVIYKRIIKREKKVGMGDLNRYLSKFFRYSGSGILTNDLKNVRYLEIGMTRDAADYEKWIAGKSVQLENNYAPFHFVTGILSFVFVVLLFSIGIVGSYEQIFALLGVFLVWIGYRSFYQYPEYKEKKSSKFAHEKEIEVEGQKYLVGHAANERTKEAWFYEMVAKWSPFMKVAIIEDNNRFYKNQVKWLSTVALALLVACVSLSILLTQAGERTEIIPVGGKTNLATRMANTADATYLISAVSAVGNCIDDPDPDEGEGCLRNMSVFFDEAGIEKLSSFFGARLKEAHEGNFEYTSSNHKATHSTDMGMTFYQFRMDEYVKTTLMTKNGADLDTRRDRKLLKGKTYTLAVRFEIVDGSPWAGSRVNIYPGNIQSAIAQMGKDYTTSLLVDGFREAEKQKKILKLTKSKESAISNSLCPYDTIEEAMLNTDDPYARNCKDKFVAEDAEENADG